MRQYKELGGKYRGLESRVIPKMNSMLRGKMIKNSYMQQPCQWQKEKPQLNEVILDFFTKF